jgi:hypothetical protein
MLGSMSNSVYTRSVKDHGTQHRPQGHARTDTTAALSLDKQNDGVPVTSNTLSPAVKSLTRVSEKSAVATGSFAVHMCTPGMT